MTNDLDSLEKDLATLNSKDPNTTMLQKLQADQRLAEALPNLIAEIKVLREKIDYDYQDLIERSEYDE